MQIPSKAILPLIQNNIKGNFNMRKAWIIFEVILLVVAVVMIAGCNGENGGSHPPDEDGKSRLDTEFNTNYESSDGIYKITGTTFNKGTATAHNVYVHIIFTGTRGSILHVKDVQLGDIGSSGEQSFSYNWPYLGIANAKIETYWDEKAQQPAPVTTVPPEPAYLSISSEPSGATVEVGLKSVGNIVTIGTGRIVGATPLTVELKSSDIGVVNEFASITILLKKEGYFDSFQVIGLGKGIEHGKTYSINAKLTPLS